MNTKKIKINRENLSYLDSEKGDITLLFIHGAFITKEYWHEQLSYFKKNYRVLAIDLAGHGNSSHYRTECEIQNFGNDINEFIKVLSLKNIIIIGHSAGSDIMLETVTQNSSEIIGLVEVDHMKNVGVELPKEIVNQMIVGLNANFIQTCQQFAKQALLTENTDSELVNRLLNDYGKMNSKIGISLLQNGFNYPKREAELLKGLKVKLNLIHVDYLPTNEENLKNYLGDNYELHKMKGTCHYPMVENPKEFNILLENILLKITKR